MMQNKVDSGWKSNFFRLQDGSLSYYKKKALIRTRRTKVLQCLLGVRRCQRTSSPLYISTSLHLHIPPSIDFSLARSHWASGSTGDLSRSLDLYECRNLTEI